MSKARLFSPGSLSNTKEGDGSDDRGRHSDRRTKPIDTDGVEGSVEVN